jgi:predicted TIM-barrel fold metal-dependent hydrolase
MLSEALLVDEADRLESFAALGPVLDVDAQVQETLNVLLPYMDDTNFAKRFISLTEQWRDMVYAGPSAYPLYEYKRSHGGDEPIAETDIDDVISAADLAARAEEVDINAGVVNPTLNLGLSEVNNDRFAVALASAYNDWLLDELDGVSELVGNMVIAPQQPDRAAEEIDRVGDESSVKGVQLPARGLVPPPGHQRYEPVYEAAQAHDLLIAMKTTVGNKTFGKQYWWAQSFAEDFVYQHAFVHMRNLTSLLFEGIPARYPDLEFLIQGVGLGWAPYAAYRLDDHYLELGYEIPALDELPSAYLDESFYWGTQPLDQPADEPEYLAATIEMIGPENVVFASDLPHGVSDLPCALVKRLGPYFRVDELRAILRENAASIYGL